MPRSAARPARAADAAPQEAQREMLTLVTARIRDAYLRKPYLRGRRHRHRERVPRALGARPDAGAGARSRRARRAPGHLHHHRPARRAAAPGAAAATGGARGGALRPRAGGRRRRPLRGPVADGQPPRAPPGGARRRRRRCAGARRAGPARPRQLRGQPLAHRGAADRRCRQRVRAQGRGAAHRRDGQAAARQRHPHRAHHAPGRRAQHAPVRTPVGACWRRPRCGPTPACW